ncbi:hypothetical protein BU14_0406s0009 [Porphyra umbilicalis]|uniref:Choice-of-anchor A domain-containing protein n=1 Tax=Porphyra umbilicalis TaxID=2786 RepID=A0A1X6NW71_PORUM|nr:hypothetical protein BU14_0406s0009 [Porphyra umbilicalis]|eukprot:OSX72770.1 hypothetical protein BU14_0406s0009 [Porphyra umbilicalis]
MPPWRLRWPALAAAAAAAAALLPAVRGAPTSPPSPTFGDWGVITYGNLQLSTSTLEGPALVLGSADLVDFDIGGGRPCHPTAPALAVAGAAHGRHGVLKGRAALGRHSALERTVGTPCADGGDASRGVTVGAPAGTGVDGWATRLAHIGASASLCRTPASGRVAVEDSVLKLFPAPASAGDACVDVFAVAHPLPRTLSSVQYYGTRRVVINYHFRSADWAGVDMATLNASRTLHSYCGGGRLRLRDTEVSGSVLAPGLRVDARSAEFRGRLAVESLTGQAVVRYEPYEGVALDGLAAEVCAV